VQIALSHMGRIVVKSRSIKLLLVLSLAVVVLIPVTAVASHQFTDVPNSNIFHNDIAWLADNGITKGCNPPANTMYCPEANVSRQQMAAFMHRLAVNKVVDAKTAVTAGHATSADTAADSNLLDGMDVDDLKTKTFAASTDINPGNGLLGPSGTPGQILTLPFNVPVAGSIVVTHSTSFLRLHADTGTTTGTTLSAVCDTNSSLSSAFSSVETDHPFDSAAGTFAYQVAAGSHTLRLCGEYSLADVSVIHAQLSAVFEPGGTAAANFAAQKQGDSSFDD
jgi:hypothetical protein